MLQFSVSAFSHFHQHTGHRHRGLAASLSDLADAVEHYEPSTNAHMSAEVCFSLSALVTLLCSAGECFPMDALEWNNSTLLAFSQVHTFWSALHSIDWPGLGREGKTMPTRNTKWTNWITSTRCIICIIVIIQLLSFAWRLINSQGVWAMCVAVFPATYSLQIKKQLIIAYYNYSMILNEKCTLSTWDCLCCDT